MRQLIIDGQTITDQSPAWVIAEIGHNHGGCVDTACKMVEAAARAGCQAVKLQKRQNATLYSPDLLAQPYENENSFGKTYGEHRAALELSALQYSAVQHTAQRARVTCFGTAFDEASADFLARMGMPAIKIASGGLTDTALLTHVARLGLPVICSTGGGNMREVDRAASILQTGRGGFALLHCTAAYPVRAWGELNLRVITMLRDRFPETIIGWSGHDSGIAMAVAAYTLGARIIEKHFTLNRAMKGTDHAFSLEPDGMRKLCRDLVRTHAALGDGFKRYLLSEVGPISKMRRRQTERGLEITGQKDTEGVWSHPHNWTVQP